MNRLINLAGRYKIINAWLIVLHCVILLYTFYIALLSYFRLKPKIKFQSNQKN